MHIKIATQKDVLMLFVGKMEGVLIYFASFVSFKKKRIPSFEAALQGYKINILICIFVCKIKND